MSISSHNFNLFYAIILTFHNFGEYCAGYTASIKWLQRNILAKTIHILSLFSLKLQHSPYLLSEHLLLCSSAKIVFMLTWRWVDDNRIVFVTFNLLAFLYINLLFPFLYSEFRSLPDSASHWERELWEGKMTRSHSLSMSVHTVVKDESSNPPRPFLHN